MLEEHLWKGWQGQRQGLSHPNSRFMEPLGQCLTQPDPVTMEIQPTPLVPVPWWEQEKIERVRRTLGIDPPLEQGPPPNYEVQLPPTMAGLFEPEQLQRTFARRSTGAASVCAVWRAESWVAFQGGSGRRRPKGSILWP